LYEQHRCLVRDLRSGGANHAELKPESARTNRDGLACNLLALLGTSEHINESNSFASWK
jgi:hypothetical protein